jgi:mannose/fructose/N-acetylgalactosamine-specific phosphotransferase system component IIB
MDVQLFRIDDRLIHGQVVLGWAKPLKSERILLCDDEISQSEWEKELYYTCVPPALETMIFNIGETVDFLTNQIKDNDKTIVLVKDPRSVIAIIERGYQPGNVNIGGIHYDDHRRKFLPYVYLNDEEVQQIHWLLDKGVSIYCQDIPTGRKYDAREIVSKAA